MWKCPKCGESLHDYEERCWNCKIPNPSLPAPDERGASGPAGGHVGSYGTAAEPVHEKERMKKCPYCAEEILEDALKCRYCLSLMPEAGQKTKPQAPSAHPKNEDDAVRISKPVAISILVFAILVSVALIAVLFSKPLSGFLTSIKSQEKSSADRNVAYEEITEYDGKGNVTKSVKTYPQEKDKNK